MGSLKPTSVIATVEDIVVLRIPVPVGRNPLEVAAVCKQACEEELSGAYDQRQKAREAQEALRDAPGLVVPPSPVPQEPRYAPKGTWIRITDEERNRFEELVRAGTQPYSLRSEFWKHTDGELYNISGATLTSWARKIKKKGSVKA